MPKLNKIKCETIMFVTHSRVSKNILVKLVMLIISTNKGTHTHTSKMVCDYGPSYTKVRKKT